ncbi:hypothetical protein Dimus_029508, partial [Dionaea muscipula]
KMTGWRGLVARVCGSYPPPVELTARQPSCSGASLASLFGHLEAHCPLTLHHWHAWRLPCNWLSTLMHVPGSYHSHARLCKGGSPLVGPRAPSSLIARSPSIHIIDPRVQSES